MLLIWIVILFLLVYAALIYYYLKGWQSLPEFIFTKKGIQTFISVIVPARNEATNISILLKSLADQTYPKDRFEIIIVDDFSTDDTVQIINAFQIENLRLTQPATTDSSKKKAIEAGISLSKGELIVTTDADCILNNNWLQNINEFYLDTGAMFIAAPVQFTYNNSILQKFQAIDFMMLQGITAASVATRFHSMCNGANLAYTKQAFASVDGFKGIDKVASGDDMLLMHKIWEKNPGRVRYLKAKKAIVLTAPMHTWKQFFWQRIRWASKTMYYDDQRIFAVLLFIYLFNLIFPLLLVAGFWNFNYWLVALIYWACKAIIEFPFAYNVAEFYGQKKLLRYFFFFQPAHIFYTVSIGLLSQFGKYEWKGRRTK